MSTTKKWEGKTLDKLLEEKQVLYNDFKDCVNRLEALLAKGETEEVSDDTKTSLENIQ